MVKFRDKGRGTGYRRNYVSTRTNIFSIATASLPGRLTQPWPLTWHLTWNIKVKVKDWVPDIVPKLRQHAFQNGLERWLASLGSLYLQPWLLNWYSTFKVKVMVKRRGTGYHPKISTTCIPKFRVHTNTHTKGLKWQLASLGSLHYHDLLWLGISPLTSNSRSINGRVTEYPEIASAHVKKTS